MATIPLTPHSWITPNNIIVKTLSGGPDFTVPLTEVPAVTLADMCNDFRREVFKKAGKTDPQSTTR